MEQSSDSSVRNYEERTVEERYRTAPDERTSEAVVSAVASVADRRETDLDRLYSAIDPDALNALVAGAADEAYVEVTFEYSGYTVTVRGDGEVVVRRPPR